MVSKGAMKTEAQSRKRKMDVPSGPAVKEVFDLLRDKWVSE